MGDPAVCWEATNDTGAATDLYFEEKQVRHVFSLKPLVTFLISIHHKVVNNLLDWCNNLIRLTLLAFDDEGVVIMPHIRDALLVC